MAHRKLCASCCSFTKRLGQMKHVAEAGQQWVSIPIPNGVPDFTVSHMEMIIEIAFLRAFLSWEAFLEESFILYLWGKSPPRGRIPKRYVYPPTREIAEQIVIIPGKEYSDWAKFQNVISRAERFFENGKPYSDALKSQHSKLQDIETIRNAIAHRSINSWERFQSLVRRELGTYPSNLSIGGFLEMTIPHSSPPLSFFENYLSVIQLASARIVPS